MVNALAADLNNEIDRAVVLRFASAPIVAAAKKLDCTWTVEADQKLLHYFGSKRAYRMWKYSENARRCKRRRRNYWLKQARKWSERK